MTGADEIRRKVAESYAKRVRPVLERGDDELLPVVGNDCCGADAANDLQITNIAKLYADASVSDLPATVTDVAFGCGNPTAIAALQPGQVVLDLGSGGGIDCFLAAKMVGPEGRVYGVDMTPEMVALARKNAEKVGATNVEFRLGAIEHLPIESESVDVVISNCVINLSPDKDQVFREAFRVLKPGGRFAVSDVVVRGDVPADLRRSMELWVGCVAGALEEREFRDILEALGFEDVSIEPTRIYRAEDARAFLENAGLDVDEVSAAVDGRIMAASVRARKPMS